MVSRSLERYSWTTRDTLLSVLSVRPITMENEAETLGLLYFAML